MRDKQIDSGRDRQTDRQTDKQSTVVFARMFHRHMLTSLPFCKDKRDNERQTDRQ